MVRSWSGGPPRENQTVPLGQKGKVRHKHKDKENKKPHDAFRTKPASWTPPAGRTVATEQHAAPPTLSPSPIDRPPSSSLITALFVLGRFCRAIACAALACVACWWLVALTRCPPSAPRRWARRPASRAIPCTHGLIIRLGG